MVHKAFAILTLAVAIVVMTPGRLRAAEEGLTLRFSFADPLTDRPVKVSVSGSVTDKETGTPIQNALIRSYIVIWRHRGPELYSKCPYQEVRTDSDGRYQLTFVTPLTTSGPLQGRDSICVCAGAPRYETRPKWIEPRLSPANTRYENIDFQLERGKLVRGIVVDETGTPMEGALVRVQKGSSGTWDFFGALGRTETDPEGRFEVWVSTDRRHLTGDDPWLQVFKPRYGVGFFWDILEKEEMGVLTVPRGGTVSGKVVDQQGAAVPGCEVSVYKKWPVGRVDRTATDGNGDYVLKGIPGEPGIADLFMRTNTWYDESLGRVTVYARPEPGMNLRDAPQYEITAQEGQSIAAPNLVIGREATVSGRLIPSPIPSGLDGLLVRLDSGWDRMAQADADGRFAFPCVQPGQHRLTAYLPTNLRGDRGIGHVEIDVKPGSDVEGIEIQLEELAEVRAQFVDARLNPLDGITAGATWTRDGTGPWTEGTKSDSDGWSVLYLYPDQTQFVRGFDHTSDSLVAEGFEEVSPTAGQVINNIRIVMVPYGSISGRAIAPDGQPLAEQRLLCTISFADGIEDTRSVDTDTDGTFEIDRLVPGVIHLRLESDPPAHAASIGEAFELKPGETKDLSEVNLAEVKIK